MTEQEERWLPVAGFTGYEVSSLGRVRSWKPERRFCKPPTEPRIISQRPNAQGYPYVSLVIGQRHLKPRVHRLVLGAFDSSCPPGMQCRHLNGDRSDNRLCNLSWGTPSENNADKYLHGTAQFGARNNAAKLNDALVKLLRYMRVVHRVQLTELASWTGMCRDSVSKAVCGKTWGHVPLQEDGRTFRGKPPEFYRVAP